MTPDKKTCFKCGAEKPLTEFYTHKRMADGHLNKCKACTKRDAHEHRHGPKFREKVLAYDRARGNRQSYASQKERMAANPTKTKAQNALGNAVRDGKLARPDRCSHCHKECKPHGHHEDYNKPLDVVWLCAACHRQLHAMYETIGRKIPA